MAKRKRMRTMQSIDGQDLRQHGQSNSEVQASLEVQAEVQAEGEIALNLELGGIDAVIEDNEGTRHTRGKTRLCHLWNLKQGHRIVVEENPIFQPVGDEAGLLGQYLGTLARNGAVCSLMYKDWKQLKEACESNILFMIKEKFLFNPKCKKFIMKSLNVKWNQHKSTLKGMYFKEDTSIEEMCRNVPEGIVADQWVYLVHYWSSPASKKVSERNKKARSMLKNPHTAGTKSFARHAHEMKMNDPEKREPNRSKVYLKTHKHDDIALSIEKQLEENPEASNNSDGRVAWEGDALSQVLGKDTNGHIKGVGLVADPKLVLQPTRHLKDMDTTTLNEKSLLYLFREMARKIDELSGTVEDLRSEINLLKYGASDTTNESARGSPNECTSHAPNANGDFLTLLTSVDAYANLLNSDG